MTIVARVFPVNSRQALLDFAQAIDGWSDDDKLAFARHFGSNGVERWFYQEIEGKPHVLSVAEVDEIEEGFDFLATSDDPFTVWFRRQVLEITGVDLTRTPMGPPAELVYEFRA